MDLRKLKTLIDLVSESNVSELEITEAEGKVRIVKGGPAAVQARPTAKPMARLASRGPTQDWFSTRAAYHCVVQPPGTPLIGSALKDIRASQIIGR